MLQVPPLRSQGGHRCPHRARGRRSHARQPPGRHAVG